MDGESLLQQLPYNVFPEKDAESVTVRQRTILLQCLLQAGSVSFSHILRITERYLQLLQLHNTTPAEKAHTIDVIASYWRNHDQVLFFFSFFLLLLYMTSFFLSFFYYCT